MIKGDFTTSLINEKCITDITYIYTLKDGWCDLASVFDCYSVKIIGWHMSKNIDADLAVQVSRNEVNNPNIDINNNLIIHSDLGSQYTNTKFKDYLSQLSINHSYSKKGYPYDNAPMESFHSCFKKEDERMNKYFHLYDAKKSHFNILKAGIKAGITEKEFIIDSTL